MTDFELVIYFLATYLIFIFIPVGVWLVYRKDVSTLFKTLLSGSMAVIISLFIKDFYYLPRPFIVSGNLPLINYHLDGSLPSLHTALSFALAVSILHTYRKLGLLLITISCLIALGRIAGGVHTLLDVSVGMIVALISNTLAKKNFRD